MTGNGHDGDGPDGGVTGLRARVGEVVAAGAALRGMDDDRLAEAFATVSQRLLDPDPDLAQDLALLPPATGLSPAMVRWALTTTLEPAADPAAWHRLAHQRRAPPGARVLARPARLVGVILAGNVFTASFRGLFGPLLARVPVVAKASSREDLFPRILERTLREVDDGLGAALAVTRFPGGGGAPGEDVLLQETDVLSVYGGDRTIAALRQRMPPTTRLLAHGHGLGAVWIPAECLPTREAAREVARDLALDVAAYDQRGCLSPQAVFVEPHGAVTPEELAGLIAERGLAHLASRLPRGPLPAAVAGAQLQWRGVAAMRGGLVEGDGYATSFEGKGPLRLGPGYRNLGVHQADGVDDVAARLRPVAAHLKVIGLPKGTTRARRDELLAALPATAAPRISPLGWMQRPPLEAIADGAGAFEGLVRWVGIDHDAPNDDG